ncbi:uridine kinase [Dactylosporangium fulvum]|uniref:Uridylate kinase n=1 Tax=Dactylosporangium fulvum TaxID=53359 RepID=A0ABY5WC40_9ACTN|nr:uridylate kinase [Dactylosporangium fulvum]UWP86764.1 uridylate kinase [Dactylosporangium fulvum]
MEARGLRLREPFAGLPGGAAFCGGADPTSDNKPSMTTPRQQVLDGLAHRILALRLDHPARVGIDGHSAAGKTTLADELASILREKTERPVLRVTVDHFKRHVDLRTQYPAGSPESYYFEMFDVDAIRNELLVPLGPGGNRHYRTQIMDFSGRTPIDSGVHLASDDAILVADGGFLQKPTLSRHWDLRIYLHIEVADVLYRGTTRDQAWMDSADAAAERYRTYYIPGEELYLAEVRPAERADILIDNRDFDAPRIVRDLPDRGHQY